MHYDSDEAVKNVPDLSVPCFANATFVRVDFASEAAARYFRVLSGAELDNRYVRAHIEHEQFCPMAFAVKNDIRHLVMTIDESAGAIFPDISIELYLEPGMQWILVFYQALGPMKPVFMKLREADIDIKVMGYDFFSATEDDDIGIFSEQLNRYLTAGGPEE
ncbi:hypothetical protein G6011_11037 [Alternaria panax]|uniref:Uncharacterized protein n=1 Tax=Alternaria panax TaxID=48097 RepID=A0AAD4ICT6_9PLEO|nr:hypothetical protein G6011_11037 [Alternaria panax]